MDFAPKIEGDHLADDDAKPPGGQNRVERPRVKRPYDQALNRKAIRLFAADLPRDYPEVEGLVMAIRHHLRVKEVPVTMREREHGRSSIGTLASIYYMIKVLLAIFVDSFRREIASPEDPVTPGDP